MKLVLAATAAAVASAAVVSPEIISAFKDFQTKYGKEYSTNAEWANRLGVFAENVERINTHNTAHLLASGEAVFGVTKFSDLTPAEFKAKYLTYKPNNATQVERVRVNNDRYGGNGEVDWRTKDAVTEVKDQGQCGSCWAFSATEAIESYAFLNGGYSLPKLSAQQITSCDTEMFGCEGGTSESAYEYVQSAGGIATEDAYPYNSGWDGDSGKCEDRPTSVKIKGYTTVEQGEDNLADALDNGPVSICVAAEYFQSYGHGVLAICPGQVDHCVQAVGYSTSGNYWLVRNSWAKDWGEDGYIRIKMGKNLCKISNDATYPTF